MYTSFARCYDALMHDVQYKKWALFYKLLLRQREIKKGARLLEIACGTGRISEFLADDFCLSCLDASEEMLSLCERRLSSKGKRARLIKGDMTELGFSETFDAVIISCDGLNYVLDEKALNKTLEGCNRALKKGGILAFDISSAYKLKNLLSGQSFFEQSEDYSYIWHNSELENSVLELSLEVFYRNPGGGFDRIIEEQLQRAWERADIEEGLNKNGFSDIRVFSDMSFEEPLDDELRLHFVAERI